MATIIERTTPSGRKRFQVRYRDQKGQQKSNTYPTLVEAQRKAQQTEVDGRRGDLFDHRAGKKLLGEVAEEWLAAKQVAPRTRANLRSRLHQHVIPAFGSTPVGAIEPEDIEQWIGQLEDAGLAPETIRATYNALASILRRAVRRRLIASTPAVDIELPKGGTTGEMRFLTVDEVWHLADAIDPRYRAAVLFSAFTGLRAGELWALRTDRVDLLGGEVRVTSSLYEPVASDLRARDRAGLVAPGVVEGDTKNRQARTVALPRFLAQDVGEHLGRYGDGSGWIFTAPDGGPVRHRNFTRRTFAPAREAAGLPGLRWHDLRHTCAALLIAQRHTLHEVKEQLGHSKIAVTSDRYGHLFPEARRAMADSLDALAEARACSPVVPRAEVLTLPGRESAAL